MSMRRVRTFKRISFPFLAIAAFVCVNSASLAVPDGASISIEVTGSILPECSNGGFTFPIAPGDLSRAGSQSVRFGVDCNAPFRYAAVSAAGALVLEQPIAMHRNFAAEVPYTVYVHIPLNTGNAIGDRCTSRQLKSGQGTCAFTSSGNAVAIKKTGEMKIVWDPPSQPLAPGGYSDRLTVTIALRI